MSLFPAFASQVPEQQQQQENKSEEWLKNSSFQIDPSSVSATSSTIKKSKTKRKSHRKNKHEGEEPKAKKKSKPCTETPQVTIQTPSNEDYCIDKTKTTQFLSVPTIARPSRPLYKIKFYIAALKGTGKRKRVRIRRYFNLRKKRENDQDEQEATLSKKDLEKAPNVERNENFTGFKQEEDMSKMTAVYNKSVSENPTDIDSWLKYVKFQDTIFDFEKSYKKGSIAKGQRVTAERKLAIVDKALSFNPGCERLLRERLNICVSVYPADELQSQLQKLVEKDQGNIILWQGYIESTQCSMSHCNTPAVLKLYNSCLSTLHQLRRNAVVEKSLLEECILRMLYQCGLFLKQSGLFEQLWTLLRMYLELNLSPPDKNKFNISSGFEEKQLVELEDVVLNSQLPIHELWLRIEKLRESCHWLPYQEDENCEDPQRLVFPEDVAELIHPITMPGNTFKLTATILTLLKTPLMFFRHTTLQDLGLDYVPWALDSVESLLPIFLPHYPVDLTNKYLLRDTQKLAVGPQYLKVFPGQEEYLEFVLKTMKNCIDCLGGKDKLAVTVWWFRFHKLLVALNKVERFKMTPSFKKKMKSAMKNLLKEEEYRNNVIVYVEYALIEYELGNLDSATKVLTTAISMNVKNRNILTIGNEEEQSQMCSLYRNLAELHLNSSNGEDKEKALQYLTCLVIGKDVKVEEVLSCIPEATIKYKHVTLQLLQKDIETIPTVNQFLPNFFTDWIVCNGWFLYLTKGHLECGIFLENILESLNEKYAGSCWQKEIVYEFYVAVLFKHCLENSGSAAFKLLDDVLYRALEIYPNNLFLLTVLAKEQSINCSLGQPWWKMSNLLKKSGHALPTLFLILIANQKITQIEEGWTDTITGGSFALDSSYTTRMVSLFKRVTSPEMCTRRCGLVWRLYLQFLHANFDLSYCRKAYYAAVEECPWLKALYIDAAIYIPAELPQIQDLLLEKQLRLHVTPEELDILRN